MAGRQTITQRIALDGGDEIKRELEQLGFVGEQAFKKLKRAADSVRGAGSSIDGSLARLQQNLQVVGQRFDALGTRMVATGRQLTTFVTAPLVAFGALSVRAFAEFESGIASVSTLVDTSVESLGDMRDQVLAIGGRTPVALRDLTDGLYQVRSAGVSARDAMRILEQSARLGVAGLGTTAQAVDIATSAINAFGIEGEAQVKLFDSIFKTVAAGKTTIAQLSQGFGAVAGIVANSGTSIEEFLAAIAALTTTGLPASQAMQQVRAAISGLTRDTEATRPVFEDLGVKTFGELVKKSGGLVAAFRQIRGAVNGSAERLQLLLGSTEAVNAVLSLTGAQADGFAAALERIVTGANEVDGAFQKQRETVSGALQLFRNNIDGLLVSVGAELAPAVIAAAEALGGLARAFTELSPTVRTVVAAIGAIVAVIFPLYLAFGLLFKAVGSASLGFAGLAGIFRRLGVSSVTGFVRLLARGIVGLLNPFTKFRLILLAIVGGFYAVRKAWQLLSGSAATEGQKTAEGLLALRDALEEVKKGTPDATEKFDELSRSLLETEQAALQSVLAQIKLLRAQSDLVSRVGFAPIPESRFGDLEAEARQRLAAIDEIGRRAIEAARATGEIGAAADDVTDSLARTATSARDMVTVTRLGSDEVTRQVFDTSKRLGEAGGEIEKLGGQFERATEKASGTAGEVDRLAAGVRALPDATRELEAAGTAADAAFGGVEDGSARAAEAAEGNFMAIANAAGQAARDATDQLRAIGSGADFTRVVDASEQAAGAAADRFNGLAGDTRASFAAAAAGVESSFESMVARVTAQIVRLVSRLASLRAEAARVNVGTTGGTFASGGYVSGPGGPTSDLVPAWLSNGEFVLSARAVRHWGVGFLAALNRLQMPGFNAGGLVDNLGAALAVPRFAAGGLVAAGGSSRGGTPINLTIGGETFPMTAPEETATRLLRAAQFKASLATGRRPAWDR
ncbi:MAG: phage tail tape measure protein [Rhodospirillaceae bacterium]